MAITVFSIPLILASLEWVFLGVKYTITPKRVRLRVKILEIIELLKSWVCILKITGRVLLSSIFVKSRFINKALKVLEEKGNGNKVVELLLE